MEETPMLNALLASILLSCIPGGHEPSAPRRGVAKLAVAIGPVETKMDADSDYKAIGESLEANAWVRTGPKAKATFEFPDGTELRVNENTEIQVGSSRRIELKMGEIFLIAVNGSETLALKKPFSDMNLAQGTFDINFFNRHPNSPEAKRVSKTVTEVT